MKTSLVTLAVFFLQISFCQYSILKVKEDYDLLNAIKINDYKPLTANINNDEDNFGDGMSHILDGYITMYQTTLDKG